MTDLCFKVQLQQTVITATVKTRTSAIFRGGGAGRGWGWGWGHRHGGWVGGWAIFSMTTFEREQVCPGRSRNVINGS